VALAKGKTVAETCRALGGCEQTFDRWRNEYGGLRVAQAKKPKALERENARLNKAVAEQTLDKLILQEAARGNF
jgi:transposase-like protein